MGFPKLDSTRVALHHSGTGRPKEADLARGMAYRIVLFFIFLVILSPYIFDYSNVIFNFILRIHESRNN
jgi:hypothetical protein